MTATPNGALVTGIHLEERIAGALLYRGDLADHLSRVKPEHFERPELCAIASAVTVEKLTDPEAIMERIVLGGTHGAAEARQLLTDLADWAAGSHRFNVALAVDDLLERAHARAADAALAKAREDIRRRRLTPMEALEQVAAVAERQRAEATGIDSRARSAVSVCMSDIAAREVSWLWPGRIPLGRLTLLVGRPGEGKSFLTCDAAARVSTGRDWPDGAPCFSGSVLLICAEDDPADTLRPRLDAHLADVRRVHLLRAVRRGADEIMFSLADLDALDGKLAELRDVRLVVIDPVGSFIGGRTDAHRDNEVRAVLAPLALVAEKHGCAVLVVAHTRKAGGEHADDLALGSRAFTGIARSVLHLVRDHEDERRRLLLPGKCNLAAESQGLAFTIEGAPPALHWLAEPVTIRADEWLAAAKSGCGDDERGAREDAADWLRAALVDGPVPANEIKAQATTNSISVATLRRAMTDANAESVKASYLDKTWYWRIKGDERAPRRSLDAQDAHPTDLSALGENERLGRGDAT